MSLIKRIRGSLETAQQNIQNNFDSERIQMVEISRLKFDADFKELFEQEPEKVERILQDMKVRGFDKSQPIIATKDGSILDGNSRFMVAKKAGIKFIPVVYKTFADKSEAIRYELHLQLDRRNLSDAEVFKMFKKLEEMKLNAKAEGKSTEGYTNARLAEELKKSERQVQKMRELSKKADEQILEKVSSGEMSINQAYSEVKKNEEPKQIKSVKICTNDFCKGVKFALDELAKGKTAEEILAEL